MKLNEAKSILKKNGYEITINESISATELEKNTEYEEEAGVYRGNFNGYWWTISDVFSMSMTDRSGGSKQYKVYAGKLGNPKTRKCLATRANFSRVFEIISDYIKKLSNINESLSKYNEMTFDYKTGYDDFYEAVKDYEIKVDDSGYKEKDGIYYRLIYINAKNKNGNTTYHTIKIGYDTNEKKPYVKIDQYELGTVENLLTVLEDNFKKKK